jgi:NAD(P)-dependent dehydrogenase (short-subunit alcohol dehydrogenase family)
MARIALVTGANRGIGREVARQLAVRGDTVVLTARDQARAERAAAELGADRAVQVAPLPRRLDVTDPAGIQRVADDLAERYGRLDALVNNAAIHYDTWQRASAADLTVVREALETNLLGAWRTTLALLPLLRAGGHGRIVNVSSQSGSLTGMGGGTPAYGVSKAALNALTRMLAAHCPGSAGPLRKSGMNRCRCRGRPENPWWARATPISYANGSTAGWASSRLDLDRVAAARRSGNAKRPRPTTSCGRCRRTAAWR